MQKTQRYGLVEGLEARIFSGESLGGDDSLQSQSQCYVDDSDYGYDSLVMVRVPVYDGSLIMKNCLYLAPAVAG